MIKSFISLYVEKVLGPHKDMVPCYYAAGRRTDGRLPSSEGHHKGALAASNYVKISERMGRSSAYGQPGVDLGACFLMRCT